MIDCRLLHVVFEMESCMMDIRRRAVVAVDRGLWTVDPEGSRIIGDRVRDNGFMYCLTMNGTTSSEILRVERRTGGKDNP